jgi:5'-nucleotidase
MNTAPRLASRIAILAALAGAACSSLALAEKAPLSAPTSRATATNADLKAAINAGIDPTLIAASTRRVAEIDTTGLPPETIAQLEEALGPVEFSLPPASGTANPIDFWLTVLHNNDGETKYFPQTISGVQYGGLSRFVTLVNQQKAAALSFPVDSLDKGVVMVSSGDNFLAGLEFNVSVQSNTYYDAIALGLIGYDAITLGNHDFDFGPDILANVISQTPVGGPNGPFISSNLDFTAEPGLQALRNAGKLVRSTIRTVNGRQVGIIGATTENLPFISSPRNTIVNLVAPAVQAEADALTAAGVNIIILSTHLQSLSNELALVPNLRNVDIVIGGGGSELLANPGNVLVPFSPAPPIAGTYPVWATDANGANVPVVTTPGDYLYLGNLVAGFDSDGNLLSVDPTSSLRRVAGPGAPDALALNPDVESLIIPAINAGVAVANATLVGSTTVPLDGTRTNVRARETNLGNLCADAILWQARQLAPALGQPLPSVAMTNSGGIRNNNVRPVGTISEGDTFRIFPFANFVTVVPNVSPATFKDLLENAVSRVEFGDGRFAQISGFRFVWDAAQPPRVISSTGVVTNPGARVREVVLNNGTVIIRNGAIVPNAPAVSMATVDFLARGGDQYPFGTLPFSTLNGLATYQQALENYIGALPNDQVTATQYPNVSGRRIIRRN